MAASGIARAPFRAARVTAIVKGTFALSKTVS